MTRFSDSPEYLKAKEKVDVRWARLRLIAIVAAALPLPWALFELFTGVEMEYFSLTDFFAMVVICCYLIGAVALVGEKGEDILNWFVDIVEKPLRDIGD